MPRSLAMPSLVEVLVDRRMLTKHAVEEVLCRLKGASVTLGQTLISEGLLSEDQLAQALAVQYGLPYDPLTDFQVDPRHYETISIKLMQRFPFVPMVERSGTLTIAVADPQNLLGLDELEFLIGKPLERVVSSKRAILEVLERSEGSSQVLRELEAEYRSILLNADDRGEGIPTLDQTEEAQSPGREAAGFDFAECDAAPRK